MIALGVFHNVTVKKCVAVALVMGIKLIITTKLDANCVLRKKKRKNLYIYINIYIYIYKFL